MNYWLVKSEPDEFGIHDLERKGREPWTGVRNYQARNFMRDHMAVGDPVLFYHSSIAEPAVVGLATVASKPYPDPTQFDETSEYFDATSSPGNPRWVLVDLAYVETFPNQVLLSTLKGDPTFEGMRVTMRGMRLSVQPVEKMHFDAIMKLAH